MTETNKSLHNNNGRTVLPDELLSMFMPKVKSSCHVYVKIKKFLPQVKSSYQSSWPCHVHVITQRFMKMFKSMNFVHDIAAFTPYIRTIFSALYDKNESSTVSVPRYTEYSHFESISPSFTAAALSVC